MKTKKDGIRKARSHYTQEEIDLILSQLPTDNNVKNLAKSLGRTRDAIKIIFQRTYSRKWLRDCIRDMSPKTRKNLLLQIVKTRHELGICVGHKPSKKILELASKM